MALDARAENFLHLYFTLYWASRPSGLLLPSRKGISTKWPKTLGLRNKWNWASPSLSTYHYHIKDPVKYFLKFKSKYFDIIF